MLPAIDIGLRYEIAVDVLGGMLMHWAAEAGAVRDSVPPDLARLAQIETEQRRLRTLRDELHPDDAAHLEKVIAEYGPQARHVVDRASARAAT